MTGISKVTLSLFVFTNIFLLIIDAQLQHNEGERVKFTFCGRLKSIQNCSIEIRRQYNKPFYQNGMLMSSSLTVNQKRRFSVEEGDSRHHIKYVVIQNVSRDDSGTYICSAYRINSQEKEECSSERVSLTVKYPPGKANCTFLEDGGLDTHLSRQWQLIECSAYDGNIPGILRCYQSGRLAPYVPRDRKEEDNSKLVKNMWIERGKPTKCCTKSVDSRPTEAGCNDFIFDIQSDESENSGYFILTPSTRLPNSGGYLYLGDPHSDVGYVKTIDNINDLSKFQLEWSGPTIIIAVILATIPLVIVIFFLILFFRRHSNNAKNVDGDVSNEHSTQSHGSNVVSKQKK